MIMLKKFLQEFFKEKKIHLAGGLLLIAGAFTLLAAGAVSESTVALLRTLMNRSVTGEITDYYLRKLNFLVYTYSPSR